MVVTEKLAGSTGWQSPWSQGCWGSKPGSGLNKILENKISAIVHLFSMAPYKQYGQGRKSLRWDAGERPRIASPDVEEENRHSSLSILYLSFFVYMSASQTRKQIQCLPQTLVYWRCYINVVGSFLNQRGREEITRCRPFTL